METTRNADPISLTLSKDQALVLSDWLSGFLETNPNFPVKEAYQRVLYDLDALLEKSLDEIVSANYEELLSAAKSRIIDKD